MKKTLGRAERVDIPELELFDLPAKIDTGAYTSSLDCEYTELIEDDNGEQFLAFIPLRPLREGYSGKKFYTKDFLFTEIKNANGVQDRYIIYVDLVIKGESQRCRFSLADRSKVRYPVLIGRKLIASGNYLVDVNEGEGLPDDEEERGL